MFSDLMNKIKSRITKKQDHLDILALQKRKLNDNKNFLFLLGTESDYCNGCITRNND